MADLPLSPLRKRFIYLRDEVAKSELTVLDLLDAVVTGLEDFDRRLTEIVRRLER